jgi:hydrogenase maturation protease
LKTQILGIGNSILSDDGVGVRVVERLKAEKVPPGVVLTVGGTGGSALIDIIEEGDRLIIIDAIVTGAPPGTIHELSVQDILSTAPIHLTSSHDIDFLTILGLGKEVLGKKIPSEIMIIAVEAADITTFSEECTAPVKAAVDKVVRLLKSKLAKRV